jgi:AraC family L-rhamnose operon regulatory protein RhaS
VFPILIQELRRPETNDVYCRSLLSTLLVEFLRELNAGGKTRGAGSDTRVVVREFLESLCSRCGEDWSLDMMADACGLQRTQFSNWVKTETGENPVQFLNRLRIDRAKEMLATTDRSITEVGADCGFQTSQYFAKVFKDYTLTSPRRYRAKAQSPG